MFFNFLENTYILCKHCLKVAWGGRSLPANLSLLAGALGSGSADDVRRSIVVVVDYRRTKHVNMRTKCTQFTVTKPDNSHNLSGGVFYTHSNYHLNGRTRTVSESELEIRTREGRREDGLTCQCRVARVLRNGRRTREGTSNLHV